MYTIVSYYFNKKREYALHLTEETEFVVAKLKRNQKVNRIKTFVCDDLTTAQDIVKRKRLRSEQLQINKAA